MKATDKTPSARFAAWSREVWVYALLGGGSLLFLWPFVWMALASVKLDRELFSDDARVLPLQPIPRERSPYFEERLYASIDHPRLAEMLPPIEAALRAQPEAWAEGIDADAARPQLARGIFKRLSQLAPETWWSLPAGELSHRLLPLITPQMIAQTRELLTRGLVFGPVVLRSYDLQEQVVISAEQTETAWKIAGPARAHFVNDPATSAEGRLLPYDFSTGDHVTLTATVTAPFPLERLHRLQFFMRPDDSWHRFDCTVEMGGRVYRAEHSKFSALADLTWQAVWWQPRGPDDATFKEKKWAVLEEIGVAPTGAGDAREMKIRLEIRQRGVLSAWWAKLERNYLRVLTFVPFGRYVATSVFLVLLQVAATVFSCSLVAYGFARLRWPGRSACFLLMLGTMMIPSQITMIPQFLIVRELGWYNTLYPLWVPSLFGNAFFVFLLHQFMRGIPRDLEEAARIDGCGALRIYWHVVLPLIRPSLAAIAIFTFMGAWNDFMGPLIYVNDQRLFPLSLGLYALNVQNVYGTNSMGLMMAGSLLMTLPVVAIFFFAQRYFIQGVALTGMKG